VSEDLAFVLSKLTAPCRNLVQLVQVQRTRNQQLESELAHYRNRYGNAMGGPGGWLF
jgi:hypothetical protein